MQCAVIVEAFDRNFLAATLADCFEGAGLQRGLAGEYRPLRMQMPVIRREAIQPECGRAIVTGRKNDLRCEWALFRHDYRFADDEIRYYVAASAQRLCSSAPRHNHDGGRR